MYTGSHVPEKELDKGHKNRDGLLRKQKHSQELEWASELRKKPVLKSTGL